MLGFKEVKKSGGSKFSGNKMEASINKANIGLSPRVSEILRASGCPRVQLWWNGDTRSIAIVPVESDENKYFKIHYSAPAGALVELGSSLACAGMIKRFKLLSICEVLKRSKFRVRKSIEGLMVSLNDEED